MTRTWLAPRSWAPRRAPCGRGTVLGGGIRGESQDSRRGRARPGLKEEGLRFLVTQQVRARCSPKLPLPGSGVRYAQPCLHALSRHAGVINAVKPWLVSNLSRECSARRASISSKLSFDK